MIAVSVFAAVVARADVSKCECAPECDRIAEFLKGRVVWRTGGMLRREEVYAEFKGWHEEMHDGRTPRASDLNGAINNRYGAFNKDTRCWLGIALTYGDTTPDAAADPTPDPAPAPAPAPAP